jgi:hypothetical protein
MGRFENQNSTLAFKTLLPPRSLPIQAQLRAGCHDKTAYIRKPLKMQNFKLYELRIIIILVLI